MQLQRERFLDELVGYNMQLKEFLGLGEIADLGKYLKKAQTLNARLDMASDKVQ